MMPEIFHIVFLCACVFAAMLLFTWLLYQHFISKMERQRRENMQSILEAQENERMNIVREVHDSLGPLLSITNMQVEALAKDTDTKEVASALGDIQQQLRQAVLMCRNISHELSPFGHTNQGLEEIIRDYVYKVQSAKQIDVLFTHEIGGLYIHHQKAASVYRVVLELINNTIKHAQAREIRIHIQKLDGHLKLFYNDDGIGMQAGDTKKGLGVRNIVSRIHLLKGQVHFLFNPPGKGAEIKIIIPLEQLK